MTYYWEIILKELTPQNKTNVAFNCTGENADGIRWTYFGVETLNTNNDEEIINELNQQRNIKIRVKKEIKKLAHPENYKLWLYQHQDN